MFGADSWSVTATGPRPADWFETGIKNAIKRSVNYDHSRVRPHPSSQSASADKNGLELFSTSLLTDGRRVSSSTSFSKAVLPHGSPVVPMDALNPSEGLTIVGCDSHFKLTPEVMSYQLVCLSTGNFSSLTTGVTSVGGLGLLPTGELLCLTNAPLLIVDGNLPTYSRPSQVPQVLIMLASGVWARFTTDQGKATPIQSKTPPSRHPSTAPLADPKCIAVSEKYVAVIADHNTLHAYKTDGTLEVPSTSYSKFTASSIVPTAHFNKFVYSSAAGNIFEVDLGPSSPENAAPRDLTPATTSWGTSPTGFSAVSTFGDVISISDSRTVFFERNRFHAEIVITGLPPQITAALFASNGDLVVMSAETLSRRRISVIARQSLIKPFWPSKAMPTIPVLWSTTFLCQPRTAKDPHQSTFGAQAKRNTPVNESIISTPDGHLIVGAGLGVYHLRPTSIEVPFNLAPKPTAFSFAHLRHLSTEHTDEVFALRVPSCNFSVPLVISFLSTRCPQLLEKKESLASSTIFTHDVLDSFFIFIYDNRFWEPEHASHTAFVSAERVVFYAMLSTLARALGMTVFAEYSEFRMFKLLENNHQLFIPLFKVSQDLDLWCDQIVKVVAKPATMAPGEDLSLLKRLSDALHALPKPALNSLAEQMVDSCALHHPLVLKLFLKIIISAPGHPLYLPFNNPFRSHDVPHHPVHLAGTNYKFYGVPIHSVIVASRWKFFRDSILPNNPNEFGADVTDAAEKHAASSLMYYIYSGLNAFATLAILDFELMRKSNVYSLLEGDETFDELREYWIRNDRTSISRLIPRMQSLIDHSTNNLELHRARIAIAENLSIILKERPEEFSTLPPEEQYAILQIELIQRLPSKQETMFH